MFNNFEYYVLEMIENAIKNVKNQPLFLSEPVGGYIGYLPQEKIAYDSVEIGTLYTNPTGYFIPSGATGASLLDNLNHIRYRLDLLESGTFSSFLELNDTPDTYSGYAGYIVSVKNTQDGLEFIDASSLTTTLSGFPPYVIEPPIITSQQDNYSPTGYDSSTRGIKVKSDASRDITGLALPSIWRRVTFYNIGNNNIVFKESDASSDSDKQFYNWGGDYTLAPGHIVTYLYDTGDLWYLDSDGIPSDLKPDRLVLSDLLGKLNMLEWLQINKDQKQIIMGYDKDLFPLGGGVSFHIVDSLGHTGGEQFLWAIGSGTATDWDEYSGRQWFIRLLGSISNPSGVKKNIILGEIASLGLGDNGGWLTPDESSAHPDGNIEHGRRTAIRFVADGDFTNTDRPTRIEFWTIPSGSTNLELTFKIVSSGFENIWNPRAFPAFPSSLNDEFSGSSLDAKWTLYDPGSSINSYNISDQGLRIIGDITNVNNVAGFYQTAPGTEYTVYTKIEIIGKQDGDLKCGIMLGEDLSGSPSTSDILTFSFSLGGYGYAQQAELYTDYATYDSSFLNEADTKIYTPWLRVRVSGYDIHTDFSFDGYNWMEKNTYTASFQPAEVGVFLRNSNNWESIVNFPFFRIVENNSNLTQIPAGNKTKLIIA